MHLCIKPINLDMLHWFWFELAKTNSLSFCSFINKNADNDNAICKIWNFSCIIIELKFYWTQQLVCKLQFTFQNFVVCDGTKPWKNCFCVASDWTF